MKRPDETDLGKIVVARTAQGDVISVGRMVSYCDAPTISLRSTDGQRINWRADLCEVLDLDAVVAERLAPSPDARSIHATVDFVNGKLEGWWPELPDDFTFTGERRNPLAGEWYWSGVHVLQAPMFDWRGGFEWIVRKR